MKSRVTSNEEVAEEIHPQETTPSEGDESVRVTMSAAEVISEAPEGARATEFVSASASLEEVWSTTEVTSTTAAEAISATTIKDLEDRVRFLESSLKAREEECDRLLLFIQESQKAKEELEKNHKALMKSAGKENQELQSKLRQMESQLQKLSSQGKEFLEPQVRKAFHDLGPSQKTKVKRKLKEDIFPSVNDYLKKRKLEVGQLMLEDVEGVERNVVVASHAPHKFEDLTQVERQAVASISDARILSRQSEISYRALRRLHPSLPPFSHIHQYDQLMAQDAPMIMDAPAREGGFLKLREEVAKQATFLFQTKSLEPQEPFWVKFGIDATKISHNQSVCVYTASVITCKGSTIGIVGATVGGDSHEDMRLAGPPFFEQLPDLEQNPFIEIASGRHQMKVVFGGDMCNLLELYGLKKACSGHPCIFCVIPKKSFAAVFENSSLANAGKTNLLRSRGQIIVDVRGQKGFSTKAIPLSPLPSDPCKQLIYLVLFCILHLRMRLAGNLPLFFFVTLYEGLSFHHALKQDVQRQCVVIGTLALWFILFFFCKYLDALLHLYKRVSPFISWLVSQLATYKLKIGFPGWNKS